MGTKKKCPNKVKDYWYNYPCGDIWTPITEGTPGTHTHTHKREHT